MQQSQTRCAGQKKIISPVDSTAIDWPDDRPIRFLVVYDRKDTRGNDLSPMIRLQWQQFNDSTAHEFITLGEWRDAFTRNYIVAGDTVIVNTEALLRWNAAPSDEYTFAWRFRVRLENPTETRKFSNWVYSGSVRPIRADRVWGIPKNPKQLKFIF